MKGCKFGFLIGRAIFETIFSVSDSCVVFDVRVKKNLDSTIPSGTIPAFLCVYTWMGVDYENCILLVVLDYGFEWEKYLYVAKDSDVHQN